MSEPRTATGQALTLALIRLGRDHDLPGIRVDRDVVAIEAEATEGLRAALSDAFDAMDAACRWAANEALNLRTLEALDRHVKGYDALLDATVKAGQAAGRLRAGQP